MNTRSSPGDIILLQGAIKNAGDFLITRRARVLLEDVWSTHAVREVDRRMNLAPQDLGPHDVLILGGGPGLAANAYPTIYNIDPGVVEARRFVMPMGLGWAGQGEADTFAFNRETARFLDCIHDVVPHMGVRDEVSLEILHRLGYGRAVLSGCPAWFDLNHLSDDLREPRSVTRILVSNPARPPHLLEAGQLISRLKREFSNAEITLVFHRGIGPDKNTPYLRGMLDIALARWGRARGIRIIDASYSSAALENYGQYDFHVGYRVHAHIAFLSQRRPSVLIEEDGRGRGQTRTLGTRGVSVSRRGVSDIMQAVRAELDSGFSGSRRAISVMQRTYPSMRDLIASLPLPA